MILDIDNPDSVQTFAKSLSEDWFDIDSMYSNLKANSVTNSPRFWGETDHFLDIISKYLNLTPYEFLKILEQKCLEHGAMLMGYHCTRHSDKEVFIKKGILPLSKKTIKISLNQKNPEAEEAWRYRSTRGAGPYFFLSYKSAKNSDNYFHQYGPEILLAVDGHQPTNNPAESIPLIIYCAIPFSIIPNKKFCTFCILKAHFIFLDPDDDSDNLFEGSSIDLNGSALDPQHIVKIENI